jgi:hypothetical protein
MEVVATCSSEMSADSVIAKEEELFMVTAERTSGPTPKLIN